MTGDGIADQILAQLQAVQHERARRDADPALAQHVAAIKAFQQRRFAHTYADLRASERYRPAADFFLQDLYGPADFARRDAQFARVVPKMMALLPAAAGQVVADMVRLHASTEVLDSAMAQALPGPHCDSAAYAAAWRAVGQRTQRDFQLQTIVSIGRALDGLARKSWLRRLLRSMRPTAQALGLGDLQDFLERGLSSFAAMNGSDEFLQTVTRREQALIDALFSDPTPDALPPLGPADHNAAV